MINCQIRQTESKSEKLLKALSDSTESQPQKMRFQSNFDRIKHTNVPVLLN